MRIEHLRLDDDCITLCGSTGTHCFIWLDSDEGTARVEGDVDLVVKLMDHLVKKSEELKAILPCLHIQDDRQ